MKGFLVRKGVRASEKRVSDALKAVAPTHHARRRNRTAEQRNPVTYSAEYFGHKLHMDQNEKLVMYGVTEYAAIDGYSGMIVAFITMPIKNAITIYESLFE